ncbi:uncharacterized protein PRCAT00000417001 [Priceomyces carsonii]|uniref:uncharacterized protein n=1 Tax=Priceomyces carsonii TaxID=28549 RepID=UPI002ED9916C|nr:unnamed protein product [Priceomyces carsonii]
MGLLPSIASTLATGLEAGPAGLVWGWFLSGIFILSTGILMSFLGTSLPTSGGLYYWTNYYCPDSFRVPLSFLVGCSNTMALCSGLCLISYGFASQVLSAVYINMDGNFNITQGKLYGVFAACVVTNIGVCCATTKYSATLQSVSICVNVFIIILFFIAVPIGVSNSFSFNSAHFIFAEVQNYRTWSKGWSFMLSWMPAIWTIGAFDSVIHLTEELNHPNKGIPIGIMGSITVCWIVGWCICIVCCAVIKDGNVERILMTDTGLAMAQIIYDALGKRWAVAFMLLISVGQYLMSCSILTAASRQIWAFARDDGLPIIYNIIKYVEPRLAVPVRATIFGGILSLVLGLLILIDVTAANALFSLAVAGNLLAWGLPVFLVLLPYGKERFLLGPFHFGKVGTKIINITTVFWVVYVIIMSMFPDDKAVDKETMNYTCVINGGVWLLSLIYYYGFGYRVYSGPKSNLDTVSDSEVTEEIQGIHKTLETKV